MNSHHCIQELFRCLELELRKTGLKMVRKPNTPMQFNNHPELDISPSRIGILHWAVELAQIHIFVVVSMLSAHL
jgi:hypothetical protein